MIGYYVHHQGEGHTQRAANIAASSTEVVVGLSSRPRPLRWSGDWIQLPRDDMAALEPFEPGRRDPTGNGHLHWVPYATEGLADRMAMVSAWIAANRPSLMVVDVSVEIAVLARLHGLAVLAVAMPGDRNDEAHRLGYGIAAAIIAPWPETFGPGSWPSRWTAKTHYVGGISRFDRRSFPPVDPLRNGERRVVVLGGTGGTDHTASDVAEARTGTPGWQWTMLGAGADWVEDPWPILTSADVIVTHAGQNSIADIAAARRPAIVIPAKRPHQEQEATALALSRGHFALCRPRWPSVADWPELLETAAAMDGERWKLWAPGDGAVKAAAVIDRYAEQLCHRP